MCRSGFSCIKASDASVMRCATSEVDDVDCFSKESMMPFSPFTFVNRSAELSETVTSATSSSRTSLTVSMPRSKSFTCFNSASEANFVPMDTI